MPQLLPFAPDRPAARDLQAEVGAAFPSVAEELWRGHFREEWERLRAEAHRQTEAQSRERQALRQRQLDLEVSRKQLAEEACALAAAKRQWSEQRQAEEAELLAARQELAAARQRLLRAEETWRAERATVEPLREERLEELRGLERRIAAQRTLLASLEAPAALANTTAVPEGQPAAVGLNPQQLLPALAGIADDLFAEHLRLVEFREQLLALREAYSLEWERARARLVAREDAAAQAEAQARMEQERVNRQAALARRQLDEARIRQGQLEARETALWRDEAAFRLEQAARKTKLRARTWAARARQRWAQRLVAELQRAEVALRQRQHEIEQTLGQSQRALLDRQERLDQRDSFLDEREKNLVAREWVVDHARDYLISTDPKPAAAQAELDRRLAVFHTVANREVARLDQRRAEQAETLAELEAFRQRLLTAQNELENDRTQLQLLRLATLQERELLDAQRDALLRQRRLLKAEKTRIVAHNRQLQEQVENLSAALVREEAEEVGPAPRLALAA